MVQRIVDDIRAALDHDLYFAALSTSLTLPDICGKAELSIRMRKVVKNVI